MVRRGVVALLISLVGVLSDRSSVQAQPKPPEYYNPSWSADGQTLLFESTRDGKFAIYRVQAQDGSWLRRLTAGTSNDGQPTYTPDGRHILFSSDRDGYGQIYQMNADGGDQQRLTHTSGGTEYGPVMAPDGQHIAFVGRADIGEAGDHLFVMRADGSDRRQLTDGTVDVGNPKWTGDGLIVFDSKPQPERFWKDMTADDRARAEAAREIMTIHHDGSGLVNLTRNDVSDCCVTPSADGTRLYFQSARGGSKGIWSIQTDGSDARRLADAQIVRGTSISPDGRFFTYAKVVAGSGGIYVYELATGHERVVIGGGPGGGSRN